MAFRSGGVCSYNCIEGNWRKIGVSPQPIPKSNEKMPGSVDDKHRQLEKKRAECKEKQVALEKLLPTLREDRDRLVRQLHDMNVRSANDLRDNNKALVLAKELAEVVEQIKDAEHRYED